MKKSQLLTATEAARQLNCDRRTICTHARSIGVGLRAGDGRFAPLLLSPADISLISRRISKISRGYKFKAGNTLHLLRKNPGRKKRESV